MTVGSAAILLEPVEDTIAWSPVGGQIPLRDGRLIDATGPEWVIHTARNRLAVLWRHLLVPEGDLLNSIRRWVAHNLRTKSPDAAVAGFSQALPFFNSTAFLCAANAPDTVPYLAFSEAQAVLADHQRWQLHYARDYYRWCVAQRFPFFDADVARKLDGIVIGGNSKGAAVRSADPEKGPLDAMEVASLAIALRSARIEGTMPLDEQAAVWLCLAFGANASQYAMMREEDVSPQFVGAQLATTLVQVPRHKKLHVGPRTEFQTRKANRFVGRILQDLVDENNELHKPNDANVARPLFWRRDPLDRGDGMEQWLWHLQGFEFTKLVQRAVKRLRVLSRTGSPLRINTRRLRYSLATRMVQEGASKWAVAVALDHTDLQNVGTYFDVDDGVVEHLNAAMAMELGKRAQAFAKVVECEDQAVNGDTKTSRRYFGNRSKDIFEPIGTCGHNHVCNVVAPIGCYICPKFQAWMDAPHDLVLDHLVEQRTRREELGMDPRMVKLEDELIAAVAGVITRITGMREMAA
ncbi:hypothetical protein [Sphingomonas sp.]|uniref:hypothetical protein n=1 Tax=Sphingomonas sp. TaxID=28214 RepID=UPI001825E2B5|nr:hypothetical protein [Sphingomonas sp.]MBA4761926.1 hypothetical protein [Sphingomonas sp.]